MNDLDWMGYWLLAYGKAGKREQYKIRLQPLDNPGWILEIDLKETPWENTVYSKSEDPTSTERTSPWYHFRVENSLLMAAGDCFKLDRFFSDFRKLCEQESPCGFVEPPSNSKGDPKDLEWLMGWYAKYSDIEWANYYGATLIATEDLQWNLTIDLDETFLEESSYESGLVKSASGDWYEISIREKKFIGKCDANTLSFLFAEFRRLCLALGEDLKPLPLGPGGYEISRG